MYNDVTVIFNECLQRNGEAETALQATLPYEQKADGHSCDVAVHHQSPSSTLPYEQKADGHSCDVAVHHQSPSSSL